MSISHQHAFIEFMLACGALRFGDFTTKSGRKTPYFINTGAYQTGSQLGRLGEFYADTLYSAFGSGVDNLFGPAYKGIPLAVVTAQALANRHQIDLSVTFNRKEAKDHGEGGLLVGYDYAVESKKRDPSSPPIRVVLIEDVTTAGTSVRESLPLIEKGGFAKVVGLVVSVDRMERGTGELSALQEISTTLGIRTAPIVTLNDLFAYLATPAGSAYATSDPHLLERMKKYRETYGVHQP